MDERGEVRPGPCNHQPPDQACRQVADCTRNANGDHPGFAVWLDERLVLLEWQWRDWTTTQAKRFDRRRANRKGRTS